MHNLKLRTLSMVDYDVTSILITDQVKSLLSTFLFGISGLFLFILSVEVQSKSKKL